MRRRLARAALDGVRLLDRDARARWLHGDAVALRQLSLSGREQNGSVVQSAARFRAPQELAGGGSASLGSDADRARYGGLGLAWARLGGLTGEAAASGRVCPARRATAPSRGLGWAIFLAPNWHANSMIGP